MQFENHQYHVKSCTQACGEQPNVRRGSEDRASYHNRIPFLCSNHGEPVVFPACVSIMFHFMNFEAVKTLNKVRAAWGKLAYLCCDIGSRGTEFSYQIWRWKFSSNRANYCQQGTGFITYLNDTPISTMASQQGKSKLCAISVVNTNSIVRNTLERIVAIDNFIYNKQRFSHCVLTSALLNIIDNPSLPLKHLYNSSLGYHLILMSKHAQHYWQNESHQHFIYPIHRSSHLDVSQ